MESSSLLVSELLMKCWRLHHGSSLWVFRERWYTHVVYTMEPHAYVWATVWATCAGDKLKPSVSGQCVFPEASSGVTECRTDMLRCIAQIAGCPAATFGTADQSQTSARRGRPQRGWLMTRTTGLWRRQGSGRRDGGPVVLGRTWVYAAILSLSSQKGDSLLFVIYLRSVVSLRPSS